jgi:hypothetical protein
VRGLHVKIIMRPLIKEIQECYPSGYIGRIATGRDLRILGEGNARPRGEVHLLLFVMNRLRRKAV